MENHMEGKWGMQPDGTYINPVLNADYSDPDAVRVGNRYYMISSTIQCSPGMVILESEDLVNWRTVGSVIENLRELYPYLGCERMGAYNKGVYAGSIRYLVWNEPDSDGNLICRSKWFVYTTIYQGGILVSTADDVKGPWHTRFMLDKNGKELRSSFLTREENGEKISRSDIDKNIVPGLYWDDNCPYWEFAEDGTLKAAYMTASKPYGAWYPHVFRMSLDGTQLLDGEFESMSAPGDHTRQRDEEGFLLDCRGNRINANTNYTAQGDIASVVQAVQIPGKEGCVIRDIVSGEALKVFRVGYGTTAGKTRFCGRHGTYELTADYIYIFDSEVDESGVRIPMLHRAKCIYGDRFDETGHYIGAGSAAQPGGFESFTLLRSKKAPVDEREPNQGAIVDVPAERSWDGQEHWYFLTHHGNENAGPNGRPVSLIELEWRDGWPVPVSRDENGEGCMQWQGKMPVKEYSNVKSCFQDSDNFGEGIYGGSQNSSRDGLSQIWFWNHAPRDNFWTLKEREGCLRMYAFGTADGSDNFFKVGNVIAQRYVDSPRVLAETEMSICGMYLGQEAGMAHFNGGAWYASLNIRKADNGIFLYKRVCGTEQLITTIPENTAKLYLRTEVTGGIAKFLYQLDGDTQWHTADGDNSAGEKLRPGGYRGDCIGLYTYNNRCEKGYVDFSYFRYEWQLS